MRWTRVLLAAALCAGGCAVQGEPRVSSVVPNVVPQADPPHVQVRGQNLLPAWSALGDRTEDVRVWVGGQPADVTALHEDGSRVEVALPPNLSPGLHAVQVKTAGGEDTLENALRVDP